jgi:acyl-coenzyme A synthetase/AMP-(fatty) acid ligase
MKANEIMKNVKIQLSKNGTMVSNLVTYGLLFKNLKDHYKIVKTNDITKKNEKSTPYLYLKQLLIEHPELKNIVAINQDKEITYMEMLEEIKNLANYLHYMAASEKGEKVSICAASSIEGIIAFFAMNSLGLVNSRIFNGSKEEKLKNNIINFDSKTVFIDENNIDVLCNIVSETEIKHVIMMSKCDIAKINYFREKNPNVTIETWEVQGPRRRGSRRPRRRHRARPR